jgi:uncharacterized protein YjbI with pentapeptide repeats
MTSFVRNVFRQINGVIGISDFAAVRVTSHPGVCFYRQSRFGRYNYGMVIRNKDGNIIHEGGDRHNFDDLDLRCAVLEGMALEGAHFDDANLEGSNLRGADFYWGSFWGTNLSGADLENAKLQGADLKGAKLTNANLRNANLGRDNVGGSTQLQGARLDGARVEGAIFEGAEYDADTIFPITFDPQKHKMVLKQSSQPDRA